MTLWKLATAALVLAVAAGPSLASADCGSCNHAKGEGHAAEHGKDHAKHAGHEGHATTQKAAATTAAAASAEGTVKDGVRTVPVTVTDAGFEPASIKAKPGETVKLAVTRKADGTCATEIVMKDFKVNAPLPLNRTITVSVKPEKKGTYTYACAMGHITGKLVVE